MSYSQNYSTSLSYSGSVRYSYPASEHGGSGTAHYSGSIPLDVTIHVDTNPFDGSINQFNNSIDVLTGSVVAMNSAQCAAILKTAEEVSGTIINGFFSTIKTELSQQIQALNNLIKATFALIMEQGKAVSEKKEAMEGDYNRISSRYFTLFSDLDNELYKRIFALDKPSFNIAQKIQEELLSRNSKDTAALNLLGIDEVASSKTMILVSSLKRKSKEIIKTLQDYITQETKMSLLLDSLLINEETTEEVDYYIPVIFLESDSTETPSDENNYFVPDFFNDLKKRFITEKASAFHSGLSQNRWSDMPAHEKEAVKKEFNTLAETHFSGSNDEKEQRVYQTMLSLWNNSEFLTI